MATCKHCGRTIVDDGGSWIDPEASGDDLVWRETCDAHDTFTADHEPGAYIELVGLYDNGGETFDRYTAVFVSSEGESWYLAMSEHPFHPQGFGQHGEGDVSGTVERDALIAIEDAPEDVQRAIRQELSR